MPCSSYSQEKATVSDRKMPFDTESTDRTGVLRYDEGTEKFAADVVSKDVQYALAI